MAVAGLVCGSRCFSVLGCFASSLLAFGSSLCPGKVRELPCPAPGQGCLLWGGDRGAQMPLDAQTPLDTQTSGLRDPKDM